MDVAYLGTLYVGSHFQRVLVAWRSVHITTSLLHDAVRACQLLLGFRQLLLQKLRTHLHPESLNLLLTPITTGYQATYYHNK